jgi:ADP-ribose pyrophosphatase YjhB (NUDIX family)
MYKVFIDHKAIIFAQESELSTFSGVNIVDQMYVNSVSDLIEKCGENSMLYVSCSDVEDVKKRIFREYEPIIAAGGLVENDGKYLIIFRNGKWDLPKGKVEKDEEIESAAVREVSEECGVSLPTIQSFLTTTTHIYEMKGTKFIKTSYWYEMEYHGDELLTPQIEEGISIAKWVSKAQLSEIRSNTYESIIDVLNADTAK